MSLVQAACEYIPVNHAGPYFHRQQRRRAIDRDDGQDHWYLTHFLTLLIGLASPAIAAAPARANETYSRLPLHFEVNRGQAYENVRFLARGAGYGLYLTDRAAVLVLAVASATEGSDSHSTRAQAAALHITIVGAHSAPVVRGIDERPGRANYFIGRDPGQWLTRIPTYTRVEYREVYPGIDLIFYGNQGQLEYDFVVAPGADPQQIALGFEGARQLEIDAQGDLMLHTPVGPLRQQAPIIYQVVDGMRREIAGSYVFKATNRVGFRLAVYDRSRPLTIDPVVLSYSTYLGGNGFDGARSIAVGGDGSAYVTGHTTSTNFPTTPGTFATAFHGPAGGLADAFVTKLNPIGSELVYSAYLGGSNIDEGSRIAVDADGNAYVTGITHSIDFPITAGAFRSTTDGSGDAYVTKVNPTGSALVYSTYLGGSGYEGGSDIAAGAFGNAYVTGSTTSRDFPTTPGAFQPSFAGGSSRPYGPGPSDAFVTQLNSTGSGLLYSTYLGGTGDDHGSGIAVDPTGSAYLTGRTDSVLFPTTPGAFQPLAVLTGASSGYNAFVAKLHPTGSLLVYSTYLGGSGFDSALAIAVDGDANAYVTGTTGSADFPTTPGAFQKKCAGSPCGHAFVGDAFVTKLNSTGSALVYSTYLGGSAGEWGNSIAVDASGHAYVTGSTGSPGFPTTSEAVQPAYAGGDTDAFVAKLAPAGSPLVYSTFLGGGYRDDGNEIAIDPSGAAYVTGVTRSTNFPAVNAFQPAHAGGPPLFPIDHLTDGFVARIAD